MRVHELAKQLGKESKDVISWMKDNGIEGKTAASSIDEETAAKVTAALGGQKAAPAKAAPAAEEKKASAAEEKKAPAAEEAKAPAKKPAPAEGGAAPAKKPAPADGEAPKKKKSKIIIVSNANNSRMGGGPANRGNGQRPGGRPQGRDDGHHTLIRSSVRPSQVNDEPYEVRQRQMQERKEAERKASKTGTPEVTNETVYRKPDRPTSTVVTATLKEGTKTEAPRSRADRNSSNSDRNSRPNAGPDNRFKPGAAPGAGNAPAGQGKDGGRKGKGAGAKDQRSRKDHIYEDDDFGKNGKGSKQFVKPEKKEETVEEQIKVITLPETMTLKELADKMKMQPSVIIKKLFLQGQVLTVNSEISYEEAENIAIEFDIICEKEVKVDVIEELLKEDEDAAEDMVARPPVICVMGHVDHGKTSLLDAIRKTNVTDREAGGITQAIGAYTVNINGRSITFLDTPGHEAFTAMRMRGANSTDIAVLVVAADDGVMPQTIEAINHAKAAGIEIIVAINKIDKPNANIDRVKQELTEYELIPADWGGSTEFVNVSAKSGEGISDLLETILLTADILELKANPNRKARGLVIEAELDKGRGPVATVLVQKGTLHVGDFISAGASHGKVRAMVDDKGRRVKVATPSTPVEILGLSDVPSAGEVFIAHENDKTAKNFAETYQAQHKEEMLAETKSRMSLDDLFNKIQEGNLKELNIIIKADVQGSVEALKTSLMKLSNDEVVVKCIHGGVGAINESDVILASASNAIIIGFNVRADAQTKDTADREGVDIRLYKVIYQAIEDIEAAMKGLLAPVYEEKIIGHAEIRQIFKASALGNIAGSYVLDGEITRGCKVRITREGEQIFEGNLASLKRFKDDVKEVKTGFECGLVFEDFDAIAELDQVEAYIMVEVPR
ncbi:MAG: translation initiation factor IF-2 [Lachnospiraceae bacterium]|nr:translation initiation factor IF-2 [Lachnospiraceae bacterium]